jgi:hypothetical protein
MIAKCITLSQPVGDNKVSFRKIVVLVFYIKCENIHFTRRREPTVLLIENQIEE